MWTPSGIWRFIKISRVTTGLSLLRLVVPRARDLETAIRKLIKAINKEPLEAVPRRRSTAEAAQLITNELLNNIRDKNKLRKLYQRQRDPAVKAEVTKLIRKIREDMLELCKERWNTRVTKYCKTGNNLWKLCLNRR